MSFSQGQLDTSLSHLDSIDYKVLSHARNLTDVNVSLDGIDSELEYMEENQNRRKNIKIIGVPEKKKQKRVGTIRRKWLSNSSLIIIIITLFQVGFSSSQLIG